MSGLTMAQREILQALANEPGDGDMCAEWIAEQCGHFYDTPWASGRLPALVRRALVQRLSKGWYRITPAGRAALSQGEREDG